MAKLRKKNFMSFNIINCQICYVMKYHYLKPKSKWTKIHPKWVKRRVWSYHTCPVFINWIGICVRLKRSIDFRATTKKSMNCQHFMKAWFATVSTSCSPGNSSPAWAKIPIAQTQKLSLSQKCKYNLINHRISIIFSIQSVSCQHRCPRCWKVSTI